MTGATRDQLWTAAAYVERFRHSPGVSKLGLLLEADMWALHVEKQRSHTEARSVLECPEAPAIRAALLEHGCLHPHGLQRAVEYYDSLGSVRESVDLAAQDARQKREEAKRKREEDDWRHYQAPD
ncbi:hypothetical protein [Streptomyces sp. 4N124]|uniref:hypothetical protein n=1 Tax=Streptomyces sp. 4N124 TaxID=3457420 RepID=UPI003FD0CC2B